MAEATKVGTLSNTSVTYLPNQIKKDYNDDDYLTTLRFIANRWNLPVYLTTRWSLDPKEIGLPLGFAARAMVWRDYYFGIQKNIDYNHLTLKEDGTRKLLKLFRGKDIFKYVNYALEPIIDISKRIPKILSCKTVSEDVISQRRLMLDIGKFMADQQDMTAYMNERFAAYFKTANGIKFLGDAGRNLQAVDFREDLSRAATNIAKDVYYRNYMNEVLVEASKDAFITGLAAIKVSVVNGYIQVERIPAYEAIFPPSPTGDQHRNDAYGGRLRFMTVQEIGAMWGKELGQDKLEDIQSMAYSQNTDPSTGFGWNYYNNIVGSSTFNWWSMIDGVPRIAVVEAQWASWDINEMEERRQCLREGVLIGNKYMVNTQITKNITHDWKNPTHTELDYIYCQPMSVFGKNMGFPEILYTYQNRIDFLQTKLDEWINQTKGTFYLINGSYLDEGVDATQIMSNISDMRVEVVKGMDTDAGETIQKFMQQGAIEMPRDTINVINQISQYKLMMADILNIPDAARGIMEGYVPAKTLNFQESQSGKGTRYFYDPLFTFFNRVMQKAVDKFKVSTLANPNFEYNLIISDSEAEIFKSTKDFGFGKYAVYLGFEDIADDGYKQRMLDIMFNYTQNPQSGYTMSDYNAIEAMDTKSEIRNYFQYRDFEIKQERLAAEQAAQEQAMMQQQMNNETQEKIAAINNEGANQRTQEQVQSKEAIEEAKLVSQLASQQPQ